MTAKQLHPDLAGTLARYRSQRRFDPQRYLKQKSDLVAAYLRTHRLTDVVIGVSGGIDSAIVVGLLAHTRDRHPDLDLGITGLIMPAYDWDGATRQDDAEQLARQVTDRFDVTALIIDVAPIASKAVTAFQNADMGSGTAWSRGQVTAAVRTPVLYYATSLLGEQGRPALVAGTTNLDEGGYLGYIGKASDSVVDLQLISDLHKSEVYALARLLDVPADVINVTPTADSFDGRDDEDVFGAPYDAVELHRYLACMSKETRAWATAGWCEAAAAQWEKLSAALESVHATNAHKYLVGSPAVHLDVLPSHVPGGAGPLTHRGWRPALQRPAQAAAADSQSPDEVGAA